MPDIPATKDCSGAPVPRLSYVAGVDYKPRRHWCGRPVPKVRAVLSWELPPSPAQPDWTPI